MMRKHNQTIYFFIHMLSFINTCVKTQYAE